MVPESYRDIIRDVVKEAVSNAVRHGKADRVAVEVCRDGDTVVVTVSDNGSGDVMDGAAGGLNAMARRAQALGGSCRVSANADGGMSVQWKVPNKEETSD
jgi:signal transduction histidine kinase